MASQHKEVHSRYYWLLREPYLSLIASKLEVVPDKCKRVLKGEISLDKFQLKVLKPLINYLREIDPQARTLTKLSGKKLDIVTQLESYLKTKIHQSPYPQSPPGGTLHEDVDKKFKKHPNPFFRTVSVLGSHLSEISLSGSNYVDTQVHFKVKPEHLLPSQNYQIHVRLFSVRNECDVETVQLAVNRRQVEATFLSKKSRKKQWKDNSAYWTALPANITSYCTIGGNVASCYSTFQGQLYFVVELVEAVEITQLVKEIMARPPIDPKANKVDDEVEELVSEISLRCPLSYTRIKIPAKGSECCHVPCFDLEAILSYALQCNMWVCPICSKPVAYKSLFVDPYVSDIIAKTSSTTIGVVLRPDGSWTSLEDDVDEDEDDAKKPVELARNLKRKRATEICLLDSDEEDVSDPHLGADSHLSDEPVGLITNTTPTHTPPFPSQPSPKRPRYDSSDAHMAFLNDRASSGGEGNGDTNAWDVIKGWTEGCEAPSLSSVAESAAERVSRDGDSGIAADISFLLPEPLPTTPSRAPQSHAHTQRAFQNSRLTGSAFSVGSQDSPIVLD